MVLVQHLQRTLIQVLYKRGVLGREDCLSNKAVGDSFIVSSAASLFCTTNESSMGSRWEVFGFVFDGQK
jgi:hypothetical protein